MPDDIDPNPTCDLCDQPATVHLTDITDGHLTQRHLCPEHAAASPDLPAADPCRAIGGLTSLLSAQTQAMSGMIAHLRGTANYIRRHGRPPRTVAELEQGIALRPPFPPTNITDPNLLTYLKESDAFLEFFEALAPEPPSPDNL